jgi:hypothetical protein
MSLPRIVGSPTAPHFPDPDRLPPPEVPFARLWRAALDELRSWSDCWRYAFHTCFVAGVELPQWVSDAWQQRWAQQVLAYCMNPPNTFQTVDDLAALVECADGFRVGTGLADRTPQAGGIRLNGLVNLCRGEDRELIEFDREVQPLPATDPAGRPTRRLVIPDGQQAGRGLGGTDVASCAIACAEHRRYWWSGQQTVERLAFLLEDRPLTRDEIAWFARLGWQGLTPPRPVDAEWVTVPDGMSVPQGLILSGCWRAMRSLRLRPYPPGPTPGESFSAAIDRVQNWLLDVGPAPNPPNPVPATPVPPRPAAPMTPADRLSAVTTSEVAFAHPALRPRGRGGQAAEADRPDRGTGRPAGHRDRRRDAALGAVGSSREQ